jgi:tripartite-type tricarboxylate transporter receptor subunit TctC
MRLGIPMQHVPYKGMQPALNDLAGGHIAMMTSPIPLALPLAHSGNTRSWPRVQLVAHTAALRRPAMR